MLIVQEDVDVTWWNGSSGYEPADLDHVVASEQMELKGLLDDRPMVSVLGWVGVDTEAGEKAWIEAYSDHAMVGFEVWG
jgi:hypothetical protein